MEKSKDIFIAFYGDDFTGSTDALEFLSKAGAKTVLFLDNPTEEQIDQFEDIDAIGVAGMTRAMPPAEMASTLKVAFESLKALQAKHVHYKVCSTFDSSPEIGNIGTAIETGQSIFENEFTPVLAAAPNLGRYSAFGHLYARMGIGSQGEIYRLDRHPSMSKHPTTPADESDLRKHLARQIEAKMGLIDLVDLSGMDGGAEKLDELIDDENKIIFFDAMYENQMAGIGEVLDAKASEKTLFSVGSSGIEKALGDHWANLGQLQERTDWENITEQEAILVLSGSVSPVTADQINYAVTNGFVEISVEVDSLCDQGLALTYSDKIEQLLASGKSVILHTCKGPDDPRLGQSKAYFQTLGLDELGIRSETAKRFGSLLGKAARIALKKVPVQRLVIAGGDTSSYVARQLGIDAVEMIAPIYSGAPLCRAYAKGSPVDGIEVNLKGGQVGDKRYFETLRKGRI
ncbi:MAG: four-carbon acid sugar kinase family protein [Cyclobacteriaceae bacterium]